MKNLRERIGASIREARKMRGMSQEELADACGINRANISKIETGKYNSTLDIIEKICEKLGINIVVMNGGEIV